MLKPVRIGVIWLAVAIWLPGHAWSSQSQGIVANDAVVLQPAAMESASRRPAQVPPLADPADDAAKTQPLAPREPAGSELPAAMQEPLTAPAEPRIATASTESPATPAPATNESRPLGSANPFQSVSEETVAPAPSNEGMLSDLDPRRNEMTRVLGALAVVIGLLVLVKTIVRRAGGTMGGGERPSGVVEILARFPVARGQQLILMKLARRVILLHHAGATMTPITEVTDPDEVAGLLGRMEAGSSDRGAAKFRQVLADYQAEHANATRQVSGRALPRAQTQVIDLTRRPGNGIGRLLGGQRNASAR